jgi:hypothetical protein
MHSLLPLDAASILGEAFLRACHCLPIAKPGYAAAGFYDDLQLNAPVL